MQIKLLPTIGLMWIVCVFTSGNLCFGQSYWKKIYGGTMYDNFYAIQPTTDGNFLIAGSTNTSGNGNYNGWLVNIKPNGDAIWMKNYGDPWSGAFFAIQPTIDGNFLLGGNTSTLTTKRLDGWLVKIKPNGDTIWTKAYGGAGLTYFYQIQPTADGNILIGGLHNFFWARDN
jgi:hypothetical protein